MTRAIKGFITLPFKELPALGLWLKYFANTCTALVDNLGGCKPEPLTPRSHSGSSAHTMCSARGKYAGNTELVEMLFPASRKLRLLLATIFLGKYAL